VIGYTSFQGRRLLETEVLKWSPDIVTVYFGWNDHWLARGRQDKDQNAEYSTAWDPLQNLRILQLIRALVQQEQESPNNIRRVEINDYETNLSSIRKQCEDRGIEVWYFTAPHAFDLGIPPYLVESGEINDASSLIPMHQEYNSKVRKVANHQSSRIIDLAAEMNEMNKSALFLDDHIHLSTTGRFYVARRMIETLVAGDFLSSELSIQRPDASGGNTETPLTQ